MNLSRPSSALSARVVRVKQTLAPASMPGYAADTHPTTTSPTNPQGASPVPTVTNKATQKKT
jgi:hypothetical protein